MFTTFFSDPTTQSKTAFNFGIRFIVFSGLKTRRTRNDLIVAKFCPMLPPPSVLKEGKVIFYMQNE